jgi:hypothetical protein
VIDDIAAGRLRVQPFAHVTLGAAGAPGEFGRGQRAGSSHRLVEAERLAEADHDAAIGGGEIADGLADKGVELALVDVHVKILLCGGAIVARQMARTLAGGARNCQRRTGHNRFVCAKNAP